MGADETSNSARTLSAAPELALKPAACPQNWKPDDKQALSKGAIYKPLVDKTLSKEGLCFNPADADVESAYVSLLVWAISTSRYKSFVPAASMRFLIVFICGAAGYL